MKNSEIRDLKFKTAAKAIFNLLEVNSKSFIGYNTTSFGKNYNQKCREINIASYKNPITAFLSSKNLLIFKQNNCEVQMDFTVNDLFELIKSYNNRPNTGDKSKKTDRNIKRKNNRTKIDFETEVINSVKPLTPIFEAFKKIPIQEKIKTLTTDDVTAVANWLTSLNYEVYALTITRTKI